jgi:hypothetical protein
MKTIYKLFFNITSLITTHTHTLIHTIKNEYTDYYHHKHKIHNKFLLVCFFLFINIIMININWLSLSFILYFFQ